MDKKDYQFIVTSLQLLRWHEFVDNPDCVKDVINEDYWNAYRKGPPGPDPEPDVKDNNLLLYLIIGISCGIVLIVGIIVIISCVKKHRWSGS